MTTTILNPTNFTTSQWSGGSTTQLYISPPDASYSELNFDFRLSSAKVKIPESSFTVLPGVNRKLMVLEGEITLNHSLPTNRYKSPRLFIWKNQRSKTLQKFETAAFNGNWETTALGTCTDFNLMTTGNQTSELTHIQLLANHYKTLTVEKNYHTVCLYLHSGSIYVEINNKLYNLKKESLLVLSNINNFYFHLQAHKRSELIISKIGNQLCKALKTL